MQIPKNNIYTVSRLNGDVRKLLEGNLSKIWLTGEISNFTMPRSGHWYLTLKDINSQIRCAMFKGRNQAITFKPTNGQQVLVRGNISVYEPRGDYQLLIDAMLPAGDGLLTQKYEALKMKLAADGLFAQHTKRTIPDKIQRIGVITSPTGAAIRDVLHVLQRRDASIEVIIYPSQVQGALADKALIKAINIANTRLEVDVLLLTRGGGSLEDLWCFNSESLAYAIYNSDLPIISAVGHEVDTTIADYVADLRAPTPSAAAEILSKDKVNKLQKLATTRTRLDSHWKHYLLKCQGRQSLLEHRLTHQDPIRTLQQLAQKFDETQLKLVSVMQTKLGKLALSHQILASKLIQQSPKHRLQLESNQLNYLSNSLHEAMNKQLKDSEQKLINCAQLLESVSPLATLSRGYSITTDAKGQLITDTSKVQAGDMIRTKLRSGELISQVTKIV